jgi:hypothetical protein
MGEWTMVSRARRHFLRTAATVVGSLALAQPRPGRHPPEDLEITDRMWIDAASTHFDGKIVVGKDLLEL